MKRRGISSRMLLLYVVCVMLMLGMIWPAAALAEGKNYEVANEIGFWAVLLFLADGDTITLLDDVDVHGVTVEIIDADITLNLNGHTLNIVNNEGRALVVDNGTLKLAGEGELNVSGYGSAVRVTNGGRAEVTNVTATTEIGFGAGAFDEGSYVQVNGNINVTVIGENGKGVIADYGGKALVKGNVSIVGPKSSAARVCCPGSSIEILGNAVASGEYSHGAFAMNGGKCVVRGEVKVTGDHAYAAYALREGSTVEVMRNATASGFARAVCVYDGGLVTVHGNATSIGNKSICIYIPSDDNEPVKPSSVFVGGNVKASGANCCSVFALNFDRISIKGDLIAEGVYQNGEYLGADTGIDILGTKDKTSHVEIGGNVLVKGDYGLYGMYENIVVHGNISVEGSHCVAITSAGCGNIEVGGDITANGIQAPKAVKCLLSTFVHVKGDVNVNGNEGTAIESLNARIIVDGNVTATGENSLGVCAERGGVVAVTGRINAPDYVMVCRSKMTAAEGSTGEGAYLGYQVYSSIGEYDDKYSLIYVRNAAVDSAKPITKQDIQEIQNTQISESNVPISVPVSIDTFTDLADVPWAQGTIEVLLSKGIMKGISPQQFVPAANITRADFLSSLVRALGLNVKFEGNFADVPFEADYYREIGIARELGITSGVGNNLFNPQAEITRQDMIALTEKALRNLELLTTIGTPADLDRFTDKAFISPYAVNSVAAIIKEGLIVGSGDQLNPLGNTTRAEAAAFLHKIYNKYSQDTSPN